jgi:hypothetical protein
MLNKTAFKKAWIYIRNVVLVVISFSLIVAVSFVFFGSFSFLTFSERLFWVGLGITLLAGVVGVSASFAGGKFGIPSTIRRPEEARRFRTHFVEYREEVEKRYDLAIQLFLIGVGCIGISALVQTFLA